MSRPVIPLVIALISGIITGNALNIPDSPTVIALFLVLALLLVAALKGSRYMACSFLLVSLFLLGILNINLYLHPHYGRSDITRHAGDGPLTFEGIICTPPRIVGDKTLLLVKTSQIIQDNQRIPVRGKILLSVKDSNNPFIYGNYIRARAKLKEPGNFNNPGGFDYKRYLGYRGIHLRGYISRPTDIIVIRNSAGGYLRTGLERYRSLIRKSILETTSSPERKILQALILGEKEGIPSDIIKKFNRAGVSHILAISGLHMGIIALISFSIIKGVIKSSEYLLLRFNMLKVSALISLVPVIAYAFIAGLHISTIRAMIMIICYLIALLTGRDRDLLNVLAFAAFLILVINPASLFDVSFQLSFAAVTAIILAAPVIVNALSGISGEGISRKGLRSLLLFLAVSLSATIGTAPIIALYFNRISSISLISNLIVIPVIGFAALPIGMLAIIAAPFAPLAHLITGLASFFTGIAVHIINTLSSPEFASFTVTTPALLEITLYYLLVFTGLRLLMLWTEKGIYKSCNREVLICRGSSWNIRNLYLAKEKTLLAFFLGLILLSFFANAYCISARASGRGAVEATFLDVGQGSSTLLRLPGGAVILVDGGGFYDSDFDLGERVLAPYLWREKIKKIDIMVMTHADQDHAGGLPFIAENFEVGEIWTNGQGSEKGACHRLLDIAEEKSIPHLRVSSDTPEIRVGDVSLKILNPQKSESGQGFLFPGFDYNNNAIVLKITIGSKSILLPADISASAEKQLISSGADLRSDMLMAPHHGGHSSSSNAFLNAVRPEIAVISCGKDNHFGFPNTDVLDRYKRAGARVMRTDRDGAVIIGTDGERINIIRPG